MTKIVPTPHGESASRPIQLQSSLKSFPLLSRFRIISLLSAQSPVALCLLALLATGLALPAAADSKQHKNSANAPAPVAAARREADEKRADLDELRSHIEAVRRDISSAEGTRADVADQLKDSEREISNISRDLRKLGERRADLQGSLKELSGQAHDLEGTLGKQQAQLAALVVRQYMQERPDSLRLMLNGADPNQISRDLYYLGEIGHARAALLQAVGTSLNHKKQLAEDTRNREAELAALEAKQKQQHLKLSDQRKQRQAVLAKVSAQIANRRKELGSLQRDEKRMTRLIEELSKVIARKAAARMKPNDKAEVRAEPGRKSERPGSKTPALENERTPEIGSAPSGSFARLKGSLHLPVKGSITNRFGAARDGGSSWKGLFLRAASGGEVRAIAGGRVVFADWMRGFGNLLIIDHSDGYLSIYGNNESLFKQVGESIRGGEAVAVVGNSGGNPESGLYFELRYQGQPLDPLKWVNLR